MFSPGSRVFPPRLGKVQYFVRRHRWYIEYVFSSSALGRIRQSPLSPFRSSMQSSRRPRLRRHSGNSTPPCHAMLAQTGLAATTRPRSDVPRPKSAPPVGDRWLLLPRATNYASGDKHSETVPSETSGLSSDESSPLSTCPSS